MAESYFEYKGIKSSDMGLKIHNDLVITVPEQDIEFISVVGRDGDLAIDNKRLKNVPKPFPVSIFAIDGKTIDEVATDISNWLRTDVGWYPLTFTGYEGYYFKALCYESFDIEETIRTYGKTVINFLLKPYKYSSDGQSSVVLTNGQTLTNYQKRVAKPLIKVTGTGNVTLKNNGVDWAILTSVDEYITIDSGSMSVYKDKLFQFTKMNANLSPLFPLLNPGNNTITWTGSVESVEIIPRWEAVV